MKQLSRYVSRSVLGAMLLVLVLLISLETVFAFLGELGELKGKYTALEALVYVGLLAPQRIYEMLPIATLIGGIVGLGMLASNSELTVMRAAGVSIGRIVLWVVRPALVLVVMGLLLGQYVVPPAQKMAETRRALALGQPSLAGWLNSYWHREGQDLVRIGQVVPEDQLYDLTFFHLSPDGRLEASTRTDRAVYAPTEGGWRLFGLHETRLRADGSTEAVVLPERLWQSRLTPDFLRMVTLEPETLSLSRLYHYASYMKQQGLDSAAYFLEFWKKTLAPFATLSMVLVACSFIFGPLRSVTMGLRILAGVMAGLLFRYAQEFLGYVSLIYDFSPVMAAGLPIAVCMALGGFALSRVR